jgi:predicted glycosyltransferase
MRGKRIDLAVGHGSRGLLIAARLLRIPSLTLYDYEGASVSLFNRLSTVVMTPEVIPSKTLAELGLDARRHRSYAGLKEEVYLSDFKPSTTLPVRLRLRASDINVVVRPPSDTAHYRATSSKLLFAEIMSLLMAQPHVHIILLPRDTAQRAAMAEAYDRAENVTIPDRAIDGASLLYYSDLVIGGGGTMNREAAVLGVPVLSIFKGEEGAVDRSLKATGKLIDIDRAQDVLAFLKNRERKLPTMSDSVRTSIVAEILNAARAK